MGNVSIKDSDYHLWLLLSMTRRAILKARKKELRQHNILTGRSIILFCIYSMGKETTPTRICQCLLRERNSVRDMLKRMEKEGLVKLLKNPARKKSVRVALTEKGREIYHKSTKRESIHKIMSSLSEEERQQLRLYLQKLMYTALKEIGVKINKNVMFD